MFTTLVWLGYISKLVVVETDLKLCKLPNTTTTVQVFNMQTQRCVTSTKGYVAKKLKAQNYDTSYPHSLFPDDHPFETIWEEPKPCDGYVPCTETY